MRLILFIAKIVKKTGDNHVSAFAAQATFFIILSIIPFLMLLLTLVQYTPVTQADVMGYVKDVFPGKVAPSVITVVNDLYNRSSALIPLTAISALWASGRGVLAITNGLNCIYKVSETRNYIMLRLRSILYTVFFIAAIVLSLVLLVFGNSIYTLLQENAPFLARVAGILISIRTLLALLVLGVFSMIVYRFVPNRGAKMKEQIPGALFTAVCWGGFSFGYSVYVDVFSGASKIYGSLTTVVLGMLWLYICMYIMLLGAEVNTTIRENVPDR